MLRNTATRTSAAQKKALMLAAQGITMCCCSALLLWIVSELYCSTLIFFAHSCWHVGMALGLYYVIIALNYLNVTSDYVLDTHYHVFPIIKGPPLSKFLRSRSLSAGTVCRL